MAVKVALRDYGFMLIMIFLIIHGFNIIIIEFQSERVNKLLFRAIPSFVFLGIGVISLVSVLILLYGMLTFSAQIIIGWLIYMAIAWHFTLVLIIVNLVVVNYRKLGSINYFIGTLTPAMWLCLWTLLMINQFRFWCMLKEFQRLPKYLRNDPVLFELSHYRYETDKLRKTILEARVSRRQTTASRLPQQYRRY